MSIRWRLAAGIVLFFIATLAVIFVTVTFALSEILSDDLDSDLSANADLVQAQVALVGLDPAALQPRVQDNANATEAADPFISVVRDTAGVVIVAPNGVQGDPLALTPEELTRVVVNGEVLIETIDLPGFDATTEHRVRSERILINGQAAAVVQVAQPTEGIVAPLDTLLVILVVEAIGAIILAVIVALWLSRGATQPIQRVIRVASEIQASDDLHLRIGAKKEPAEAQKLSDTFDAMMARLEKAFQEQQDFVMDVSHEIRTPLTVLKGTIDLALMQPDLEGEDRDQYERMSNEVSRLIRLTGNLLYIAGADAGRLPERRPVELDVVCLEVLRQSRDLRQDVRVAPEEEDQVVVDGDRDQLKQMVLNLVENAVKYTPSGGEVRLSFGHVDGSAYVRVKDNGPGIPEDMLPHIFERFYRGNHRSKMGGTGLGLAIADRIARSHGGSISAESKVGEGSTFTVVLPVAPGYVPAEAAPVGGPD